MKKENSYFMEQLSCQISAIKRNNTTKDLQQMRGTVTSEIKLRDADTALVKSRRNKVFENSICLDCRNAHPKIGWKRDFTYKELQDATEGFSVKNFIAESGFGPVYMGKLNGMKIAIKKIRTTSFQQEELTSSFSALGGVCHENLAMLLGICIEGNHMLLVYEYICNGSLEQHLSSKNTLLNFHFSPQNMNFHVLFCF